MDQILRSNKPPNKNNSLTGCLSGVKGHLSNNTAVNSREYVVEGCLARRSTKGFRADWLERRRKTGVGSGSGSSWKDTIDHNFPCEWVSVSRSSSVLNRQPYPLRQADLLNYLSGLGMHGYVLRTYGPQTGRQVQRGQRDKSYIPAYLGGIYY